MDRHLNPHDEEPVDPALILRLGTIAAVDLAAGKVEVATGDVRTSPIPFSTGRAGDTRIWSPPTPGEQVLLLCPGGDIEGAIALGAIARDAFPLAGNTLRELIAFKDGALLAYDPEAHHLDITLPGGATIAIASSGGLSIDGDVEIDGDLSVTGDGSLSGRLTADDDVVGGGKSLKSHVHGQIQSGTSFSGPPQ